MRPLVQLFAIPLLLLGIATASAADAGKPAPAAKPADTAMTAGDKKPAAAAATVTTADLVAADEAEKARKKAKLESDNTWVAMFKSMGTTGYFIAALALLLVIIWIERVINLRLYNLSPEGLADKAMKLWDAKDYEGIKALAQKDGSTLARLINFVVNNREKDFNIVAETAATVAQRGIQQQHQANYWLTVISTLGPLLGLFGTVVGMIDSFRAVAIAGDIGDTAMVAEGIYKALVNTLCGLAIAMTAICVYFYYKNKLAKFALILEDDADRLLVAWFAGKK